MPEPVSVPVQTDGGPGVSSDEISKTLRDLVDLSPRGIINQLDLSRPIYKPTATYGHFGRPGDNAGFFTWERLDLVEGLRRALM